MVARILLLAAALFAALGALLVGVGVEAIFGRVDGGMGGGIATVVVSALPFYVGYLLARSAKRIRVGLGGPTGRIKQRETLKGVAPYVVVLVAGDVFAPVPGVLKVAMTFAAVVVGVLLLAVELEPSKQKRVA
jgi:hypothetical protein